MDKELRISEIENRIAQLPKGTLTYKRIKGKEQPYLQWTENGKSCSKYIKVDERLEILCEIEERNSLQDELRRLKAYSDSIIDICKRQPCMSKKLAIGEQQFESLMENGGLYVDKTKFIEEWWESPEQVVLITRPRRFGKTLMVNTVESFFSVKSPNAKKLFEKLYIGSSMKMCKHQGKYPVISMTFAAVKSGYKKDAVNMLCVYLYDEIFKYNDIMLDEKLTIRDRDIYEKLLNDLQNDDEYACINAIKIFSRILHDYYGEKVIILLDEYDTPLQEAYLDGDWDEMVSFYRRFFNESVKTNKYIQKVLMTGITRVSRESLFSDMNNVATYTVTNEKYATSFGFTEQEVFDILEFHNIEEKEQVKAFYDGFVFGGVENIYNPWSILNYASQRQFRMYWVNSGGYGLLSKLLARCNNKTKEEFEILLNGGSVHKEINENIAFEMLDSDPEMIWALMLESGYLKADNVSFEGYTQCDLSITNKETRIMFFELFKKWFLPASTGLEEFCKCLVAGEVSYAEEFLNHVLVEMVSFFDVGGNSIEKAPERFYHGLVLGMLVQLKDEYVIKSNRESGYGRYDLMLTPKMKKLPGIVIEFKVMDERIETTLEETCARAMEQIEKMQYETELVANGVDQVIKYGIGFEGKVCKIRLINLL